MTIYNLREVYGKRYPFINEDRMRGNEIGTYNRLKQLYEWIKSTGFGINTPFTSKDYKITYKNTPEHVNEWSTTLDFLRTYGMVEISHSDNFTISIPNRQTIKKMMVDDSGEVIMSEYEYKRLPIKVREKLNLTEQRANDINVECVRHYYVFNLEEIEKNLDFLANHLTEIYMDKYNRLMDKANTILDTINSLKI